MKNLIPLFCCLFMLSCIKDDILNSESGRNNDCSKNEAVIAELIGSYCVGAYPYQTTRPWLYRTEGCEYDLAISNFRGKGIELEMNIDDQYKILIDLQRDSLFDYYRGEAIYEGLMTSSGDGTYDPTNKILSFRYAHGTPPLSDDDYRDVVWYKPEGFEFEGSFGGQDKFVKIEEVSEDTMKMDMKIGTYKPLYHNVIGVREDCGLKIIEQEVRNEIDSTLHMIRGYLTVVGDDCQGHLTQKRSSWGTSTDAIFKFVRN